MDRKVGQYAVRLQTSHRHDSQCDRRDCESQHEDGGAYAFEIAYAQVGDDGADEVNDQADAGRDTNRRRPDPDDQAERSSDLARGEDRKVLQGNADRE